MENVKVTILTSRIDICLGQYTGLDFKANLCQIFRECHVQWLRVDRRVLQEHNDGGTVLLVALIDTVWRYLVLKMFVAKNA